MAACTRVNLENNVLRESGHPSCPTRKFSTRSTRDKGPVSGKLNLQQTQTGLKVSGGDLNLTPVVKW